MLTWKDVIHFSVSGNPKPDKRVEKTESEWKELLTPEQFRITRKKELKRPTPGHYAVFTMQENMNVSAVVRPYLIQQ